MGNLRMQAEINDLQAKVQALEERLLRLESKPAARAKKQSKNAHALETAA